MYLLPRHIIAVVFYFKGIDQWEKRWVDSQTILAVIFIEIYEGPIL